MHVEEKNPIRETLHQAKIGGEMLLQLINNILDSGKLGIDEIEIIPSQTEVYSLISKLWEVITDLVKSKEVKSILKISKNIPKFLRVDQFRIMQVILNLVQNSIKFTSKGRIDITVEYLDNDTSGFFEGSEPFSEEGDFERKINILRFSSDFHIYFNQEHINPQDYANKKISQEDGFLRITIVDAGIGMKKEALRKVLRSQSIEDCLGLGLNISRTICQRMGGTLEIFSKYLVGTVVMINIPVTCQREIFKATPSITNSNLIEPSVLVVDDEIFSRKVLVKYFERIQMKLAGEAFDGEDGYKKYLELTKAGKQPSLVTMDINMPGWDGKKTAAMIRKFEVENGIKPCMMFMVSGNSTDSEIKECLDQGRAIRAQHFLKKPVNFEEMTSHLKRKKMLK